jgi:hypothetical protein
MDRRLASYSTFTESLRHQVSLVLFPESLQMSRPEMQTDPKSGVGGACLLRCSSNCFADDGSPNGGSVLLLIGPDFQSRVLGTDHEIQIQSELVP